MRVLVAAAIVLAACGPSAEEQARARDAEVELQNLEAECETAYQRAVDLNKEAVAAINRGDDATFERLHRQEAIVILEHSRCFIEEIVDDARATIEGG